MPPRKPPSRKGSLALVSRDLLEQIHGLEKLFAVSPEKLKSITERFVAELDKGLSEQGGSIPMLPTWTVGFADGTERGAYLALDMGGTNLRVCEVTLKTDGKYDMIQSKYLLPEEVKSGNAEKLFDYIADCLMRFVEDNEEQRQDNDWYHLGFTFSYPCKQEAIDHGVLERWTKGFDVKGVEGEDVVALFAKSLQKKKVPVKVSALINDTTGTLIASNFADKKTLIGCIFGTGCNAAYMERVGNVPKLAYKNLPPDLPMAINCEWGAFDNEHHVLPRTHYDVQIDEQSPRPGQQAFEKMIAGNYMGEIVRMALVDLHEQGFIFENKDISRLRKPYHFTTPILSEIESDPYENLMETHAIFLDKFNLQTTDQERTLIRKLAELVGQRAARLSACGVAAIVIKQNIKACRVGADGSVFNKYPFFPQRITGALVEILGAERGMRIEMVPAHDGSGVGAALIGKELTTFFLQ